MKKGFSQFRKLLAEVEVCRLYNAIVLTCGFIFAIGLCFTLRPRFEFSGNLDIVSWISANKYPKQQEMFYYVASLFFVPFFTALVWGSWLFCSSMVSRLTGLPAHQVLRKYALTYLPFILILRNIQESTFSGALLVPLILIFAAKIAFIVHDLSRTKLRGSKEAIFYRGSSDLHRGVFLSGVCVSFFVLITYSDNAVGLLSCLRLILLVSSSVWLFWLLYSRILSAIVKRPFNDILAHEVYSNFPLAILLLVSLLFEHRDVILAVSLALVILLKAMIIIKSAWFEKISSIQFHRYIPEYVLIPALIYVFFYSGGNIHGDIDMFHEGERLAPLNALLRGKLPYRDIYLQHGLFYNAYRPLLAARLFGPTLAADRVLGHILAPLGYVSLYLLGLQVFRTRLFVLLSIWIIASGAAPTSDRQALGLVSMAIIAGYIFSQRRRLLYRFHLRPVLAGVCATLAIFYSLEIGLYTLATGSIFLLIFGTSAQGRTRDRFSPLLSYLAGVFAAFLPFAFYFSVHRAIDDLFVNSFVQCRYQIPVWGLRFPPLFPELSKIESLETLKAFILSDTFNWYFPILVYLITLTYLMHQLFRGGFWSAKSNIVLLLLLIGGITFFRTPLGRSDIWHLYSTSFAWLICIFLVEYLFIGAWKDSVRGSDLLPPAAWRLSLVIILAWYAISLYNPMDTARQRLLTLTGYQDIQRDVEPPLDRAGRIKISAEQASQIEAVVDYIRSNTAPDDTIFDFSSQGAYYFFADRPMASKYHQVCYAATGAMQKEVIEDLERHRTKLVIFATGSWFDNIDGVPAIERHHLIARYLEENYIESIKIGQTVILRRR